MISFHSPTDMITYSHHMGGGESQPRTAIEGSFSAWGGLGKLDRGLGRGEPFFPDSDSNCDETFQISRKLGRVQVEFFCLLDSQPWPPPSVGWAESTKESGHRHAVYVLFSLWSYGLTVIWALLVKEIIRHMWHPLRRTESPTAKSWKTKKHKDFIAVFIALSFFYRLSFYRLYSLFIS
jgi:hypothetical protein